MVSNFTLSYLQPSAFLPVIVLDNRQQPSRAVWKECYLDKENIHPLDVRMLVFLSFVSKLHILSQMEILSSILYYQGDVSTMHRPKKEVLGKKGKDFNRNWPSLVFAPLCFSVSSVAMPNMCLRQRKFSHPCFSLSCLVLLYDTLTESLCMWSGSLVSQSCSCA